MLPPATQDRILRLLPATFTIAHRTPGGETIEYNWETTRHWANEDAEIEGDQRPAIICQPTTEGMLREQDQPLNDYLRSQADADDTIAYGELRGMRLYDEWTITLVDDGGVPVTDADDNDAGIVTADDRVGALALRLTEFLRFEDDETLYTHGDTNEIPVLAAVVSGGDTSAMVDDVNTSRRTFTVRLRYTLTHRVAVDAVAGMDTELTGDPAPEEVPYEIRF